MSNPNQGSTAENAADGAIELALSYDRAINYAFQQNAIPVIRELRLKNSGGAQEDLTIRISTEPAFASTAEINVQRLEPAGEFRISPVDLALAHDFLELLTEKVCGYLKIDVLKAGVVLVTKSEPIDLLARNEWCGLVSLPEILAAFVTPNDPAIMPILGRASVLLQTHTGRAAFNGYQDKSRKRAWEQVASIYKAVGELGIRYISPPASFESTGQKVRLPSEIISQKFGTCLDLTLLMAACCEQAGLNPLVLMHEGHAYAGCWLDDRTFPESAHDDLQQVRKMETDAIITVFETTMLASESPGTLESAELHAKPHLKTEIPFRLALDIRRARGARILPLPQRGRLGDGTLVPGGEARAATHDGLGNRGFIESVDQSGLTPPTPESRIDQWKSRLLDLSLRNRLLNFRETNATIRIVFTSPEHIEDELAAEREIVLRPKPKVLGDDDPRSAATYTKQQRGDALAQHLADELRQGRLHTDLDQADHGRRLTELFRSARTALEENGANSLYAAIGFLEWREAEHSDRVLRAPLLLVPIELKRRSVLEGFSLRRIDEETKLNVTLMEMLRQHFQKEIRGLDPLPEDHSGVDVALVFQIFREAVRDLPGWEVKPEMWLGQFSFTKFLLWKDLSDRLDDLTRNRIVHHLVHEAGIPFSNPTEDIKPAELDDRYHPSEIFCPRSADSSQLAAVMAAAAGHDFVLEGPPGTGKSQTITNIIAHCLADGKRVLFVAEKRAALDVVYRRLKEEGLEPFCLELHSNKSGKADVLAQFDRSLRFVDSSLVPDWAHRTSDLEQTRAHLNGYSRSLHHRFQCGLSVYHCYDYLLPRKDQPVVRLPELRDILEVSVTILEQAREIARVLQDRARPLGKLSGHPLTLLMCADWSPVWAERTLNLAQVLGAAAASASVAFSNLASWLQLVGRPASRATLANFGAVAESLRQPEPVGPAFLTTPWSQLSVDLDRWISLAQVRAELRAKLHDYDETRLLALDLDPLHAKWQSAQSTWFLLKWLRIGSVRRQVRKARNDGLRPAVATLAEVLASAIHLRQVNAALAAAAPTAAPCLGVIWNRGEPAADALVRARCWGEGLHAQLIATVEEDLSCLARLRTLLAGLFAEGTEIFGATNSVGRRLSDYSAALLAFNTAYDPFRRESRLDDTVIGAAPDHLAAVKALTDRIPEGWGKIREWCSWQKIRQQALQIGLSTMVGWIETNDAVETDLAALFERSFRQALLFAALDRDPILRGFFGHEHADRIGRFRELDGKIAGLTRDLIRGRLAGNIPTDSLSADFPKAELGLLRREIGKRMRHIPVRKLLANIPTLLPRLKPCVLMSPLSVAQYLDASHQSFDVVIFDEASQIPVWDAVGAIARGKQLIVVGDPKQLPPTNFFNTSDDDEDDLSSEEFKDMESILDELLSNGLRHKRLQWHYRSRHEGLITFSNRQYYENSLLTFPSPDTSAGGVQFRHLPAARYDKGKSRTNMGEARALVDELVRRLRKADGPRFSYGVVTFSQAQQQLVENLLDEERRKYPAIEIHFGDKPPVESEPVFVKNLESVQGDERDVILFSICYGPDETGRISMNFGPLNRDGGERRLNVAITRAKHEVIVFSGLRGDQIDLTRTRARGVRDLKYFLDYAERGPLALVAATSASRDGEADSEFERLVAERIRDAGYDVHHQVGCSDYRIDLGVVDSAKPGRYLLGVECDGATYHRAATARDRDKLRQSVLEDLGWRIHRIWSTDWWHRPDDETRKLLAVLKGAENDARAGR